MMRAASGRHAMKVETMDRYEADWPMVERGWKAHVLGEAPNKFTDPIEALKKLKEGGDSDQYLEPFVIVDEAGKGAVGTVEDNDKPSSHRQLPRGSRGGDLQGFRVR